MKARQIIENEPAQHYDWTGDPEGLTADEMQQIRSYQQSLPLYYIGEKPYYVDYNDMVATPQDWDEPLLQFETFDQMSDFLDQQQGPGEGRDAVQPGDAAQHIYRHYEPPPDAPEISLEQKRAYVVFEHEPYLFLKMPQDEAFVRREGIDMEHCLSVAHKSYCDRMREGAQELYSMTDSRTGKPVVDIEVALTRSSYRGPVKEASVTQVRGVRNQCPPKDEYLPALMDFFQTYGAKWKLTGHNVPNFDGKLDGEMVVRRWQELQGESYQAESITARRLFELGGAVNYWLDPKGLPHESGGYHVVWAVNNVLHWKLPAAKAGTNYHEIQDSVYMEMFKRGWMRVAIQHDEKWMMVESRQNISAQWEWVYKTAQKEKLQVVDDQQNNIIDFREQVAGKPPEEVTSMSAQGSVQETMKAQEIVNRLLESAPHESLDAETRQVLEAMARRGFLGLLGRGIAAIGAAPALLPKLLPSATAAVTGAAPAAAAALPPMVPWTEGTQRLYDYLRARFIHQYGFKEWKQVAPSFAVQLLHPDAKVLKTLRGIGTGNPLPDAAKDPEAWATSKHKQPRQPQQQDQHVRQARQQARQQQQPQAQQPQPPPPQAARPPKQVYTSRQPDERRREDAPWSYAVPESIEEGWKEVAKFGGRVLKNKYLGVSDDSMEALVDEITAALRAKPMHLYQLRERFPNAGLPPEQRDKNDDHALFVLALKLVGQTNPDLVSKALSMQPRERWMLQVMVLSNLMAEGDLDLEDHPPKEPEPMPDWVRQSLLKSLRQNESVAHKLIRETRGERLTAAQVDALQRDPKTHHHLRLTFECGHTQTCRCSAPKTSYMVEGTCDGCRMGLHETSWVGGVRSTWGDKRQTGRNYGEEPTEEEYNAEIERKQARSAEQSAIQTRVNRLGKLEPQSRALLDLVLGRDDLLKERNTRKALEAELAKHGLKVKDVDDFIFKTIDAKDNMLRHLHVGPEKDHAGKLLTPKCPACPHDFSQVKPGDLIGVKTKDGTVYYFSGPLTGGGLPPGMAGRV